MKQKETNGQEETNGQKKIEKKKSVHVVSFSPPISFKKEGLLSPSQIKGKLGGLAIAINGTIPEDKYVQRDWTTIMPSPWSNMKSNRGRKRKEEKFQRQLKAWEKSEGMPEGSNNILLVDSAHISDVLQATNSAGWPVFHSRVDIVPDEQNFNAITPLSWEIAETLLENIHKDIWAANEKEIKETGKAITNYNDKAVWIHDYQGLQLAGMLREAIAQRNEERQSHSPEAKPNEKPIEGELSISYFHHLTWPNLAPGKKPDGETEDGKVYLGENEQRNEIFKDFLERVVQADAIGFHTKGDTEKFLNTVRNFEVMDEQGLEELEKRVYVNPIGIQKKAVKENLDKIIAVLEKGVNGRPELGSEKFHKSLKQASRSMSFKLIRMKNSPLKDKLRQANMRIKEGGASFEDCQTVLNGRYFDPEKIHLASVSRFDYTKGLKEFMQAYQSFLQDKQTETGVNPGEKYQLNLVTVSGRAATINAYAKYEREVMELVNAVKEEFPGAIDHFDKGIPFDELPAFNGAVQIPFCSSIQDGYVMSIGEQIETRKLILEHPNVDTLLNEKATGVILSNGTGISEDLGGDTRESNLEAMTIIAPTVEGIKEGLKEQIAKIETLKVNRDLLSSNSDHLEEMSSRISDLGKNFGPTAFKELDESRQRRIRSIPKKPKVVTRQYQSL